MHATNVAFGTFRLGLAEKAPIIEQFPNDFRLAYSNTPSHQPPPERAELCTFDPTDDKKEA